MNNILFSVGKPFNGKFDIPYDYKHVLSFTDDPNEFKVSHKVHMHFTKMSFMTLGVILQNDYIFSRSQSWQTQTRTLY
jgi:hypothetical protein